mgnify:CR=1 FL=1
MYGVILNAKIDILVKERFTNRNSKEIVGINVSALERFENDAVVSVETLIEVFLNLKLLQFSYA